MPLFSSADRKSPPGGSTAAGGPAFPYDITARISLWLSVVVAAALFAWGAWQRRWIADDGLIVLRTVRNLLAGNGPVFNKGERVESNTSTLWTYLNYLGALVGGPTQLEYVTLWLALVLSVVGLVLLMLGAGRLYAPSLQGRRALLLPAGALVYIAVPPARDFATSGLENGLVLAYLGLLWWMMVCWSQALRSYTDTGRRNAVSPFFDAALAFVAGLSVLVRPGMRLNQLRLRQGQAILSDAGLRALHAQVPLVDGTPVIGDGLGVSVDLRPRGDLVGWRAKPLAGLVFMDRINHYPPLFFW